MTTTRRNQTVVTQIQPGTIDWTEDDADRPCSNLAARQRSTFVPAAPAQWQPPQLARPDHVVQLDVAPRALAQDAVTGSHLDQARSFLAYALPLCAGFALAVLIVAILATPLIAVGLGWAVLRSLGVYFIAFLVAYGFLLVQHLRHTPAGIALRESDNAFRFLRDEQQHRHQVENTLLQKWLEDNRR